MNEVSRIPRPHPGPPLAKGRVQAAAFSQKRVRAISASTILLATAFAICTSGCRNEVDLKPSNPSCPIVFVRYYPGFMQSNSTEMGGTVAAVWADGTIVRATSDDQIGKSYVKGRLRSEDFDRLRQQIDQCGILRTEIGMVTVDAASLEISIRTKRGVRTWGCSPDFDRNTRTEAIKKVLCALEIQNPHSVDAEPYRGYPHDWYK